MADEVCLLFAEEVKEILQLGVLHSAGSSSSVTPLRVSVYLHYFATSARIVR